MAKKTNATLAMNKKSQNYTTTWLRNALKSVGITTAESIEKISPNLFDVTKSSAATTRDIVSSIRKSKNGNNRITETLKSNKYVQYAQKAYKNAMSDIKTGNLNNTERQSTSMEDAMNGDVNNQNEGFTFGDENAGEEGQSNVNVNYVNSNNSDALLYMSSQIQNQTKTQVKTQKASMDAFIAVNAASIQQTGKLGSEIVGQLTNVNSNLSALVQYQNENMTKFIEASIAYYEKSGPALENKYKDEPDNKIKARDVLGGANGGFSTNQYKTYVKQHAKKMLESSNIGLIKSIAENPMFMNMMVANPVGFLSQGLVSYMIPTVLKTSLESMEKTFNTFMPTMLSKISNLADTQGNDFVSGIKRSIGKTFGLRVDRTTDIGNIEIKRGATPFDGETKHAITEIITKELRDQTGYLELIANHYSDGKAKEQIQSKGEFWSYSKNSYIKKDDIDTDIAEQIVNSIRYAFNDSSFGQNLQNNLVNNRTSEAAKKEMAFSLDEFFVELERQKEHLSLDELLTIVEKGGASDTTKNLIKRQLKKMIQTDPNAYNSLDAARMNSQGNAEEVRKRIMADYAGNNLLNSRFVKRDPETGEIINSDVAVDEIMKYRRTGKANKKARNVSGMSLRTSDIGGVVEQMNHVDSINSIPFIDNLINHIDENTTDTKFANTVRNGSDKAIEVMNSLMRGDISGTTDIGIRYVTDGFKSIGNKLKDMANDPNTIAGEVKANFKSIGNTVKDGFMMKLFGREKDPNTGKYVDSKHGEKGIIGTVLHTITGGFDGWIDAFFGKDENNPEEARKQHKKKIVEVLRKNLPNGITGGMIGTGVGMLSTGSVLGMLVGGPIGGAAIGAATGFLSKNKKFQEYLFGKDNEDGSRTKGLISDKVQKFFKEHKSMMVGSAGLGTITGSLTGGGILGTLIGGPLAGAIMGMATSTVLSSDTFKKFLFGDEEKGQKGLFKGVSDAFKAGFSKKGGKMQDVADVGNTAGMGILGAGGGALTAALLGKMGILGASLTPLGPVGGALMGLGLSIKAQSGTFKQWLFGEDNALELGNGKKVKKQGVLGQLGNSLTANIIQPMKHEIEYISKDFSSTVKHKILAPFAYAAEGISGKVGEVFGIVTSKLGGIVSTTIDSVKDTVGKLFSPVVGAVGKTMEKATDFAWKTTKFVMSTPGNIVVSAIKALDLGSKFKNWTPIKFLRNLGKDVRNLVFSGIKGLFKGIFSVATAPFKLLGSGIKKGWDFARNLGGKVKNNKVVSGLADRFSNSRFMEEYRKRTRGDGTTGDSLIQRMNRNNDEYKEEQKRIKEQREQNKIHDKNAKLINKISKGQFSADTDDARTWLKYNDPAAYEKLVGKSITEETRIAKDGHGTSDLSDDQLANASLKDLNEDGRQTKLLYDLRTFADKIFNKLSGKSNDSNSDESIDENDTDSTSNPNSTENSESTTDSKKKKRKNLVDYKGYVINTTTAQIFKLDDAGHFVPPSSTEEIPEEVLQFVAKLKNNGASGEEAAPAANKMDRRKLSLKQMWSNVKNYFKTSFFSNTRAMFKRSEPDSDITAEDVTQLSGEHTEPHALGGILEKGLSIVGEKGAELLFQNDDGETSVLDNESTEEAIDDSKKKKGNKLKNWIRKASAPKGEDSNSTENDSIENRSDEERRERKFRSSFLASNAKSKEEANNASRDATIATLQQMADARDDSQKKALNNAKTAAELQREAEEQAFRDRQDEYQTEMLASTAKNTDATLGFSDLWESIMGAKDGLFMVAAIEGFKWLKNNFPGVVENISKIASNVAEGLGTVVETLTGEKSHNDEIAARTNGNTASEQAVLVANDLKNGNFITDANGNATSNTDAALHVLGRTGMNFMNSSHTRFSSKLAKDEKSVFGVGKKIGKGVSNVASNVGTAFTNYKKETSALAEIAREEGSAAYKELGDSYAQRIGARLFNKTSNVASKVATKIETKASASSGLLSKVCGYIDEFFKFIETKFAERTARKLAQEQLGEVTKKSLLKVLKENWSRICDKVAAKIFAITGVKASAAAISFGLSEAIFATIGALNGLSGTAKLFQVDGKDVDSNMKLISSIFGLLTGTTVGGIIDIIFSVLSEIMNTDILHSLAVGMYNMVVGKDSEKSKKLQSAHEAFSEAYVEERDAELEKQWKTQQEAGILDSSVTFEMFRQGVLDGTYEATYVSFADWNTRQNKSIGDRIASTVAKPVKGIKNLFSKNEIEFRDDKGNNYKKNDDGTYNVINSSGTDLGKISKKAIPSTAEKYNGKSDSSKSSGGKGTGPIRIDKVKHQISPMSLMIQSSKSVGSFIGKDLSFIKSFDTQVLASTKSYLNGTNSQITLNVPDKNGPMSSIYEMTGNILSLVLAPVRLITSGLSKVKNLISSAKTSLDNSESSSSSGGFISNVANSIKGVATKIGNAVFGGGKGEDTVNGGTYYSQNDARWANDNYNTGEDNAKMSDTGCGPTALAMVASDMGASVDPTDMANLAKATGDRDETGTNWNFVNKASNILGLGSNQTYNPSAAEIDSQLNNGSPVLLSGVGGTSSDPYTSAGHYVVATGKDSNGNVLVNDPRGKSYSKSYNINDIAKHTGSAWVFGGGRGTTPTNSYIGLGSQLLLDKSASTVSSTSSSGSSSGNLFTASDVISIARNEIGYTEKASNSDLDSKTANAGTKDWTKYGRDLNGTSLRHPKNAYWCATFVTWCFWKAANEDADAAKKVLCGAASAACANNISMFKAANRWIPKGQAPQPGDIIFYTFSHTGLVVGSDGTKVYTIEGNTTPNNGKSRSGCAVADKSRNLNDSQILGYGRPSYDGTSTFNGIDSSGEADAESEGTVFDKLSSFFSSAISEFSSRAFIGDYSNTDYSSLLSNSDSSSSADGEAASEGATTAKKGQTVTLPSGLGTKRSFMGWQTITSKSSNQYKLRTKAGQKFDNNGYGKINGRYTVATTNTYGNVGDYIDVQQADGSTLKAIIADVKSQSDAGCNKWGHQNGDCVIEYVVDKNSWYPKTSDGTYAGSKIMKNTLPGATNAAVTSITNKGSFFEGGSGKGASLSKRDRYRLTKAKQVAKGGRGPTINSSDISSKQQATSTKQYKLANTADRYITVTKDSGTSMLLMNAIEILAAIAGNTLDASTKLNALNKLQNVQVNGGNSNNLIVGGNGNKNVPISNSSSRNKKQDYTAKQIAIGGY